ncbi:hypothetical protein B0H10DRAFT_812828 [Mycena sp. CBHHK59/15]|nr:hypothetical protein B0H10DRAFT_812828 [Mycena sp. CBHHK59/15]
MGVIITGDFLQILENTTSTERQCLCKDCGGPIRADDIALSQERKNPRTRIHWKCVNPQDKRTVIEDLMRSLSDSIFLRQLPKQHCGIVLAELTSILFRASQVNVEMEYSSNGSQSNFGWDRALPPSLRNQSRPLSTSLQDGVPDSEDEVQTSGKLLLERNSNLTNEISKLKEHNSDLNNKIVELEESFYREEEENQNLNHELVELKAEKRRLMSQNNALENDLNQTLQLLSQTNTQDQMKSEGCVRRIRRSGRQYPRYKKASSVNHATMRETSLKTWTVRRYYHLQIQIGRNATKLTYGMHQLMI